MPPQTAPYTELFPLTVIWTIALFLVYLFFGDGSTTHERQIVPYRSVWTILALVVLGTTLIGYSAYWDVRSRVEGYLSAQTMAQETMHQLSSSADEARSLSRVLLREDPEHARGTLRELAVQVSSAYRRTQDALEYVHQAEAQGRDKQGVVYNREAFQRIDTALATTLTSTRVLSEPISYWLPEGAPTPDAIEVKDLVAKAEDLEVRADFLDRSIQSLAFDGLAIFLWLGVLFIVLVLFPWMLYLLFIYRSDRPTPPRAARPRRPRARASRAARRLRLKR